MSQIEKLLSAARAELGVMESPPDSNNVKYNTWFYGKAVSGGDYAWCCVFVAWCFEQAGLAALWLGGNPKETAYCPFVESAAKAEGQWVTGGYQSGDIVLYDFTGTGEVTHVGIVESVNKDGSLVCIEGNTSPESDDNGGCVMRRSRTTENVQGAYRPNYQIETEEDDMVKYDKIADMPEYAQPVIAALCDNSVLRGSGGAKDEKGRPADLNLDEDMVRLLVIDARAGAYGAAIKALAV